MPRTSDDAIEAPVGKRHLLGVRLDPLDVDASSLSTTARMHEELRSQVGADDRSAEASRRYRDIAAGSGATSGSLVPGFSAARSRTTSPTGAIRFEKSSQFPAAHVARDRARKSSTTLIVSPGFAFACTISRKTSTRSTPARQPSVNSSSAFKDHEPAVDPSPRIRQRSNRVGLDPAASASASGTDGGIGLRYARAHGCGSADGGNPGRYAVISDASSW